MLSAVLIINAAIAAFGFYVTWHLWRFRQILAQVADSLFKVARSTDRVMPRVPGAILSGQLGSRELSDRYRRLEFYLQQIQKILALIYGGKRLWQRRSMARLTRLRQLRRNAAGGRLGRS